jgi:hypothetical protein
MSQQEFESYLRLLARFLHLNGGQRAAIARELRAHMEDRMEDLLARGYTREEAIQTALDEFGDAAALAGEFGRIGRRRRWIMRTTTATIGIAAAVLLVSFLLPEHRGWLPAPAFTHADESTAVAPASGGKPERGTAAGAANMDYVSETETPADRQTLELLRSTVSSVELPEGTSLADAIDYLRSTAKIPLTVNWAALALVGVERTTDTGGLNLHEAKAATVLAILLDNVSQAGGNVGKVRYDVADGVVRIGSQDDLSTRTIVRIYDCRDLIGQSLTPAQKKKLESLTDRGRGERSSAFGTATRPAAGMDAGVENTTDPFTIPKSGAVADILAELRARDAEQFIDLIVSTVEPGRWAPESALGAVNEYDGLLVVRHNWAAQQQVVELLRAIRKAKAARGAIGQ